MYKTFIFPYHICNDFYNNFSDIYSNADSHTAILQVNQLMFFFCKIVYTEGFTVAK
jgi:hypothetical protein